MNTFIQMLPAPQGAPVASSIGNVLTLRIATFGAWFEGRFGHDLGLLDPRENAYAGRLAGLRASLQAERAERREVAKASLAGRRSVLARLRKLRRESTADRIGRHILRDQLAACSTGADRESVLKAHATLICRQSDEGKKVRDVRNARRREARRRKAVA